MKWILTNWLQKKKYEKFFTRVEEDFFSKKKYNVYLEPRILESLKAAGETKPKRASRIVLGCIRQALLDKYLSENRYIRFLEDNQKAFFLDRVSSHDVDVEYEHLIATFIHNKHGECSDFIRSHIPKYYRKFADDLDVHLDYPMNKHGEKEMMDDIIMLLNHK